MKIEKEEKGHLLVGSHQWKWVLGDGSCIRFWENNWVDGNSPKNMFPQLYSLSINRGGFVNEFTKLSPHEERSFGEIKFRRRSSIKKKKLLASRGMDLQGLDLECEWCNSIETENHILLHCYWSWLVWSFIFKWFGIESPLPRTFESLLRCNPYRVRRISFYWKVVIRFTAWHIWLARKEAVFNSRYCCPRLRLRAKTNEDTDAKFHSSVIDNLNITPRLRCKTKTKNNIKSSLLNSNPSSPRSPFSIFKSSLGFSRSNCGLCLQSVKTGHKTAIFTAECSHTFHFPCISNHVKLEKSLICPVCKSTWKDASFLTIDHNQNKDLHPNKVVKSRPYDDDEPLRTPRAEQTGVLKNVEVMLMSEVAVISGTDTHETYALVLKVKAPPPARVLNQSSTRAPIDLVAVLDVSASMGGAKLQMLKRAMRLVISSLGSADRLAIVAFSACPKRVLPLKRMSARGQRSARRIIDQLAVSRGTCAGEALRKATKVLEDRRERNPVASIILLSDGHEDHASDNASTNTNTNSGRQQANHVSSTRFAHVEIPVHTLEKTGDGYSYESNEPAENAFTKCVGGLLSVVAQDLRIELGVAPGSDPAEITAVYSCNGKPVVLNPSSVRFGDLYAEEEREVLVEMRVPRSSNNGSHHHVLSARCCYNDPATQQVIYGGEKALLVPRAQTVRSSACSPKIERLRNLFIATRAVAESRLLVEHNKLTTAHHLLSSARALLKQSVSAQEFVKGLESELVDVQWRVQYQHQIMQQQQQGGVLVDENGEPLTPTSAWRAAEKLAKVAVTKKSFNRKIFWNQKEHVESRGYETE
ncbi:von Willebrand factor, type A [Artemisia annua]|uniref:von Willebrand factor, type A n=1 Tax=Artemisia annua TaxID=35608 RepID=A0A2U1Q8W9_ARTAN|nr:von Willebrand factor, type A [Artemisia annua]